MNALFRRTNYVFYIKANYSPTRIFSSWLASDVHIRDHHDYIHLLKNCWTRNTLKEIHAQIIIGGYEQNIFVATRLIDKYINVSTSSSMEDAQKVFDILLERDNFLWNLLLQGYSKYGPLNSALRSFIQMRVSGFPLDEYTFPFMLKACGGAKEINMGMAIHGQTIKSGYASDLFVGNALVAFYGKCQQVSSSRKVFDEMPQKDIVSWNSMISVYVANDLPCEALKLFHLILNVETVSPDRTTLVSILPACAQLSAVKEGLCIHSCIVKSCMKLDAVLGSGLISLYANIGRLKTATLIFDRVPDKNIVIWNTMIKAYGTHGHADEALKLFYQLVDAGLSPDDMIFLCLLSACSHAGMISEGLSLFKKMEKYGVKRNHLHYACVVDLYSRAGLIDKALEIVRTMPVQAEKDAYGALLGACRIHNNIEIAEIAVKKLFELDPENAGRYLILIKMYEDAGRVEDAARLRKMMRDKKIQRPVGCSAIEIDFTLHKFGAEDVSHPLMEQIFDTLHELEMLVDEQIYADQFILNE